MDNLKCNRLTCRKSLAEKAVVTTCSHIFCVECANELFNASRLCPACDTSLTEPDDVVVCSLNPSNDYKTSVLSGLNPTVILEICSRAMSFWQYQIHQEHSFQQAVIRNLNEKNMQMQKELHNVIREANGEISVLNTKIAELQRDLELERRKSGSLQDSVKERDKEYQKLKVLHDKIKRKALLAPALGSDGGGPSRTTLPVPNDAHHTATVGDRPRHSTTTSMPGGFDVGAVVGDMEANGIQRTPIRNRTIPAQAMPRPVTSTGGWRPQPPPPQRQPQRQPFNGADLSFRSANMTGSEQSDSANEVEALISNQSMPRSSVHPGTTGGWGIPRGQQLGTRTNVQRAFAQGFAKRSGVFRPAGFPR